MSALDIDDAKRHLKIGVDTYDTQLQEVIDAAEAAIAVKCGPLASTTYTERLSTSGGPALVLKHTPVLSLTSITQVPNGVLPVDDFMVDEDSGVVERVLWPYFWAGRYDIEYEAGRADVPPDLLEAIRELVRYLWEPQRGGSTRTGSRPVESDPVAAAGAGIERLRRVQDLIRPYVQVGN